MRRPALAAGIVVALVVAAIVWWATSSPQSDGPLTGGKRASSADPAQTPTEARPQRGSRAARTPQAAEAAATEPVATKVKGLVVAGRVIDSKTLRPVSGVHVQASQYGGTATAAESDASGRFEIDVGARDAKGTTSGRILCSRDPGLVGAASFSVAAAAKDPFDVGTIALGPGGSLDVRVTHAGATVAGAMVSLFVSPPGWISPEPSLRLVDVVSDAQGQCRFAAVPAGTVAITAFRDGFGRGSFDVVVPTPAGKINEIELTQREVAVSVSVRGDGSAIAGATFEVSRQIRAGNTIHSRQYFPPLEVPATDAAGQTRIIVGAKDDLSVRLRAKGYVGPVRGTEVQTYGTTTCRAGETQLRLEMLRNVSVRCPVVAGERPVPPDGTIVQLRPQAGSGTTEVPRTGRMVGSELVVDDVSPPWFSAIAVAPDGSIAVLWAKTDEPLGRQTSFIRPRQIDVTLTEEGQPLAGAYVLALNSGNNAYGSPVPTDASGHAVIKDLEAVRGGLTVQLVPDASARFGNFPLGTVNLDKDDATLQVDVARVRTIVVKVDVDGSAALPATCYVTPATGMAVSTERDEAAGKITVRMRPQKPGEPVVLTVNSPGFLWATAKVPGGAWNDEAHVDIALQRGAVVTGRAIPPADRQMALSLEKEANPGTWTATPIAGTLEVRPDTEGGVRVNGLAAGTYRLADRRSGATTTGVEVAVGCEATLPVLDLSAAGTVKGRVEGPDGFAKGARVVVEGDGITQGEVWRGPVGAQVMPDGTFQVRIPGDRVVRLRPTHPTHVAAPEGGTVELQKPRDDVVLRLVPGATATMELSAKPEGQGMANQSVGVMLFRDEPAGTPLATLNVTLDGQTITLGGYTPGTYTMWIDAAGWAPVTLRNVQLAAGQIKLPRVELSRGSTVRVKMLVKTGQSPPSAYLFAQPTDGIPYSRGINVYNAPEIVVTGLGPGKFKLSGGRHQGQHGEFAREIEVDGTSSLELEWDLR